MASVLPEPRWLVIAALGMLDGSASGRHSYVETAISLVIALPVLLAILSTAWRFGWRIRQQSLHAKLRHALRLAGRGRYTAAEQIYLAVLERCRPKRPGDRTIMLLAATQIGLARTACGRPDNTLESVLHDYGPERYPEDRAGWMALAMFAEVLVRRGRYGDGIALAARVGEDCARRWGATSRTTAAVRLSLSFCLLEGNRPAEAIVVLTDLLAMDAVRASAALQRCARRNLAQAHRLLGHLDQAEPELRAVLAEYDADEYSLPSSLWIRSALAKIAAERGRDAEAAAGFGQVLAKLRATVGEDGPWTLATRFELANLTARSGNRSQALAEHQAVLAARTRVLGPDHPDTKASQTAVAEYQARHDA